MGNLRDRVDVRDIAVGVAESLQIDRLGVFLNRALNFFKIMGVYEGGSDAVLGQGVSQQVVAAAVDGLLGNDVVAGLCQCFDGKPSWVPVLWRCIEVVVTRTTRNRFVSKMARGFESHHLHQKSRMRQRSGFLLITCSQNWPNKSVNSRPDSQGGCFVIFIPSCGKFPARAAAVRRGYSVRCVLSRQAPPDRRRG